MSNGCSSSSAPRQDTHGCVESTRPRRSLDARRSVCRRRSCAAISAVCRPIFESARPPVPRFAIIAEGQTDQTVIENLLIGYFESEDELAVNHIQPLPNTPGGWTN